MGIRLKRKGEDLESALYGIGAVAGLVAFGAAMVLLTGFVVQWILSACGIYKATYAQVVGVLAIWEILKPRSSSKK